MLGCDIKFMRSQCGIKARTGTLSGDDSAVGEFAGREYLSLPANGSLTHYLEYGKFVGKVVYYTLFSTPEANNNLSHLIEQAKGIADSLRVSNPGAILVSQTPYPMSNIPQYKSLH
jgi:hypothetical protein